MWKTILFLGTGLWCIGCEDSSEEQLRARSAFDLQCPQKSIRIRYIDDRTAGVIGCGQRMTYVESCERPNSALDRECTWILNSDSHRHRKADDD